MKHSATLFFLGLALLPQFLWAQTETFDIVTYQSPAGWKKDVKDFAVSYSMVDLASGMWCQMGIYKSVASSGDGVRDFSGEWKALINQATYAGSVEPVPTARTENGWTINAGGSTFKWHDNDAQIILLNISGYGKMVSITASMNSDQFMPDVERFVQSIDLKKPEQQSQPVSQSSATPSVPIVVTASEGVSGIFTSTTNFDDGWVAQPFADYVRVVKGPVTVLLHYAIAIDDNMRNAPSMTAYLWDRVIAPRYRTSNVREFQNEAFTYNKTYFLEGDAVEISTGKSCYVGFRVLVANGIARCIEIISPTAAVYQKELPDQAKIEAMTNYNKFAVSASDITGVWEESTSSGIDMYSTVTGQYAGMNTSASADSFTINAGGTYESTHKGAFGMTGSLKFYDQKYTGKWTLTPWDVTMTDRFEGKTEIFWCEYEAVRGGRVLKLTNKAASGIVYRLVRVR